MIVSTYIYSKYFHNVGFSVLCFTGLLIRSVTGTMITIPGAGSFRSGDYYPPCGRK